VELGLIPTAKSDNHALPSRPDWRAAFRRPSARRPATHRKDSRMKRLVTLVFGLALCAAVSGCCCFPCCGS